MVNKKTIKLKKRYNRNTKNKSCKNKGYTACCPHMKPDKEGRYAATATDHILEYKGHKYKLKTCCHLCGFTMNKIAREKPSKFKKLYIKKIDNSGNIHAKNKYTGKMVQILKLIE